MTQGDQVRDIKKKSLWREIQKLKQDVGAILNMDGDASENDPDIKAYRTVIAQKEAEYQNL